MKQESRRVAVEEAPRALIGSQLERLDNRD